MTDVVALAAELLAIDSTSDREGDLVDFVSGRLVSQGWNVTIQEVTPGRGNVWASRTGGGVTLSTHLDTVPPFIPPQLRDDRLFGRGACDAKGIAAAMMVAAGRLAADGEDRVDLLFVVGEEKGSDGARAANQLPATSRFLVNGEPTESALASGAKGSLRATLVTRGREAHSAYPQLGESAIVPMLALLAELPGRTWPVDDVLGDTTVNIGTIRGGSAGNIVPGRCESELMFRLVGEADEVKRGLEAWVGGRAEITYGSHIPQQFFQTLPGFRTAAVAYTSDIPLLGRWGTPLLFGPGSIHDAHTSDEYIRLDELRESVDAYVRIVRALLAS